MKRYLIMIAAATMIVAAGCAKKQQAPALPAAAMAQAADTQLTESVAPTANPVVKTVAADITDGDAIMKAIIAQQEGKVMLVDFWATWCGPCRRAMTQIDEIKGDLMGKGCVFVYITGESSPENDWKRMIANIDGVHYRLTSAQWEAVCKLYNIPGIPSYMVVGKDGNRAYDNFSRGGYPGSDVLKNNVEVALTK